MAFGRLGGLTVYARDWGAMFRWYTEVLGLEAVVVEAGDGFALLDAGDAVMLGISAGADPSTMGDDDTDSRVVPGFEVDDIDDLVARLTAAGVEIDGPEDGGGEGYRLARIWDPEGNQLNLYTYESG